MPQEKTINTVDFISQFGEEPNEVVRIKIIYSDYLDCAGNVSPLPNVIFSDINLEQDFVSNGQIFSVADLYAFLKNYPDTFLSVDSDGNLIVTSEDSGSYSIDADEGDLIYDPCGFDCGSDYVICGYVENQGDYVE